jgi:hypothetical protein
MITPLASDPELINLVMPLITWKREYSDPLAVNFRSPKSHRRAVWKIAQFFRREFHYDLIQYGYEGDDDDFTHAAYLWVPDCAVDGFRVHCIGATCFRKRGDRMAMQWIWLHPFWRRQRLLTRAWPRFQQAHGSFDVETPLSDAMKGFLHKNCVDYVVQRRHVTGDLDGAPRRMVREVHGAAK